MAFEEAIWSGATLFFVPFVNLYEQTTLSYLIVWQSQMVVAYLIYSAGKELKKYITLLIITLYTEEY